MPAPYGVVPTGFSAKTLEEILEEIHAACRDTIDQSVNLSSYTVLGQYCGIIADQLSEVWELAQVVHDALNPDNASDAQLSNLARLTGTDRRGSTKSVATVSLTIDVGTYLAGTLIANVSSNPDSRFVNRDDLTIAVAGVNSGIIFEAETAGIVQALSGTLTVISEPITGWTAITNPTDATEGEEIEGDPALRLRREREISAAGSASDLAMQAAVSVVDGVLSVTVLSNSTGIVDANGVAPYSQEIVLFDGIVPAASDNEIAQAIWDNKTGGVPQVGSDSGTATDTLGDTHTVYFSRVIVTNVWLEIDVDTLAVGYVGNTALKAAVADWGDVNLGIGTDVRKNRIITAVLAESGIQDVTNVRLGFAALPVGTANLSIGKREIADLDTSRITIYASVVAPT